jgi:hypothetical protein
LAIPAVEAWLRKSRTIKIGRGIYLAYGKTLRDSANCARSNINDFQHR